MLLYLDNKVGGVTYTLIRQQNRGVADNKVEGVAYLLREVGSYNSDSKIGGVAHTMGSCNSDSKVGLG